MNILRSGWQVYKKNFFYTWSAVWYPGCWGKNEISFNALKKLNSNAYYKIENDYLKIEKIFGNNIYLEFTIEEDSIYYLDFIYRRKNIYVGEE